MLLHMWIISPTVTYSCATWAMKQADGENLDRWERKILRKIFGGKMVNGRYERLPNEELMEMYGRPKIINVDTLKEWRCKEWEKR